ncbi:MAG: methyltransferase, partial [Chitinivibrionales bacterium]|nr:methyltransferase [Chitinivibrionales bacterium]
MKRAVIRFLQRSLGRFGFYLACSMRHLYRPRLLDFTDRMDYVRLNCLELAAFEIREKQIPGSAAEVGVYRGDFACKINEAFPDRTLYL